MMQQDEVVRVRSAKTQRYNHSRDSTPITRLVSANLAQPQNLSPDLVGSRETTSRDLMGRAKQLSGALRSTSETMGG